MEVDIKVDIKVDNNKDRYGFIKGRMESYNWYALVQKVDVDYGINPETLEKGQGKIVRLCIYKDIHLKNFSGTQEDYVKRLIYANYKRRWDVLSENHKYMVARLVDYLQRRYSIKVIK